MVYENPELRLVGAAQNLVLGQSEVPDVEGCGHKVREANSPKYNVQPGW